MALLRAPWLWLLAATLAAALVFTAWPGLDLWFTGLFWSPQSGFFLHDWPPFLFVYRGLPILTWAIVLALLALFAIVTLAERPAGPFDRKTILFLLLSFALAPGLITNTMLKDHWGRARPSQVVEFGGTKSFSPALEPAGQCERNCSFVSGHGAMAFALIGFAFLPTTQRRRQRLGAAIFTFGGFVGLARIAQGGHFLSDTVFAALLSIGTAWALHRWIVEGDGLEQPAMQALGRAASSSMLQLRDSLVISASIRWRRWLGFNRACALAILVSALWFDRPIARRFEAPDDRLTAWFHAISDLGLGWGWLVASGGAALLLWLVGKAPRFREQRERFAAWALVPGFVFLSVALSGLAADIIKILVGRTRPKLLFLDGTYAWTGWATKADHWSFPSGHVTNVAALALALYFLWPRHMLAYAAFVALIALSRVGGAQHFLGDTIGSLWVAVLVTCYLRGVFLRSGISFADAKAGVIPPRPAVSWTRLLVPGRRGSP
jgi:lipid A 4'-phosphatase